MNKAAFGKKAIELTHIDKIIFPKNNITKKITFDITREIITSIAQKLAADYPRILLLKLGKKNVIMRYI